MYSQLEKMQRRRLGPSILRGLIMVLLPILRDGREEGLGRSSSPDLFFATDFQVL